MFTIGKATTQYSAHVNFVFAHGYDSFAEHRYGIIAPDNNTVASSRTVSGVDANRPVRCTFTVIDDTAPTVYDDNSMYRNTYIVSVVRTPQLLLQIFDQLPREITLAKVYTSAGEIEFWYVMGVRKEFESTKSKKLVGIRHEGILYHKELFRLSGNIPADLLRSFKSLTVKNVGYLHGLCIHNGCDTITNNSPVSVLHK